MDMEPGIINVKQEVPGVGTMNQKVGFVSMLLSATGYGAGGYFRASQHSCGSHDGQ